MRKYNMFNKVIPCTDDEINMMRQLLININTQLGWNYISIEYIYRKAIDAGLIEDTEKNYALMQKVLSAMVYECSMFISANGKEAKDWHL